MTADVDVIVIGGGLSGGLPAAAYLQKAGAAAACTPESLVCSARACWPRGR